MPDISSSRAIRHACRSLRRSALAAAASTLVLVACNDGTGPRVTLEPGFLQLSYAGAIEDSVEVLGALRFERGQVRRQPFVAAGPNQQFPESKLTMVAFRPLGLDGGVYLAMSLPDVDAGATIPIVESCSGSGCSSVLLLFGVGPDDPLGVLAPPPTRICWIDSGTVTITARAVTRVRGTFAGTGACIRDPAAPPEEFVVELGVFSAPVSFGFRPKVPVD